MAQSGHEGTTMCQANGLVVPMCHLLGGTISLVWKEQGRKSVQPLVDLRLIHSFVSSGKLKKHLRVQPREATLGLWQYSAGAWRAKDIECTVEQVSRSHVKLLVPFGKQVAQCELWQTKTTLV